MSSSKNNDRHILIRITKIDQFLRFFTSIKEFSVNKFKKLYQKGKDLIHFFSNTKNILILSHFTIKDVISFSELQEDMHISSSLLSYNLKKMTDLGFLEKIQKKESEGKRFSYYRITELGKSVISQIFSTVA